MSMALVSAPLGYETPPSAPPLKLAYWYSLLQELGVDTCVYDLELELFLALNSEKDAYNYLNHFFAGLVFIPHTASPSNEFLFQTHTEVPTLLTYAYCREDYHLQKDIIQKKSSEFSIPERTLSRWVETFLSVMDSFSRKIARHETVVINMPLPGSTTTGLILGRLMKENNPEVKIVASGAHINTPELASLGFAMEAVDFMTFYEDELAVRALGAYDGVSSAPDMKEIPNLVWRNTDLTLRRSKNISVEKTLDNLPFPDYSPFDLTKYGLGISGNRALILETARSCPFNCKFCSNNKSWSCLGDIDNTYRCKSIERVKKEIDAVINTQTVNSLSFSDCMLNYNKGGRFARLLTELASYDLMYYAGMRVDQLTCSLIESMAEAGFVAVVLGVESFDEHCLRQYEKGSSGYVAHAMKMISFLLEKGIAPQINILIGTPYETAADVKRSIATLQQFAAQLRMHYPVFSINASITYLNYPSRMYFELLNQPGHTLMYHELPTELSQKIPYCVKKAAEAIPFKMVLETAAPPQNKRALFDMVYSLWSQDEEILRYEIKALEKYYEKIVDVWRHENILLQYRGEPLKAHSHQTLPEKIICTLHDRKCLSFRALLEALGLRDEPISSEAVKKTWATLHFLWKKEIITIRPFLQHYGK